jgi:hypothetical protein
MSLISVKLAESRSALAIERSDEALSSSCLMRLPTRAHHSHNTTPSPTPENLYDRSWALTDFEASHEPEIYICSLRRIFQTKQRQKRQ